MEGREVETQHGYHPLPRVLLVSHATVGKEGYQTDVWPQETALVGLTLQRCQHGLDSPLTSPEMSVAQA